MAPFQAPDASQALWGVVLWIHLLAMAAWVGGMTYALLVLRPSLGLLDPTPRMNVHLQTLRRFFRIVWIAMPAALVTGWAMLLFREGGFARAPWFVDAMQATAILMALLFASIFFGPYRRLRRAVRPAPAILDTVRNRIGLTLALGILTVLVASLGHFPGTPGS